MRTPLVVVIMGVAGSGKTTVGRQLAGALGVEFHDADEFHTPENLAKMSSGIPLTDADRVPWLAALRAAIDACLAGGRTAVVTCSALKERYRGAIVGDPARVKLVYLAGDYDMILRRVGDRRGHFMKAGMLASQFADLEPPSDALKLDASLAPDALVARIREAFQI
jgi:gluconokinase